MSIFIFLVILVVLVLVHEFGHFIVAKKSGIRVDEFGFGFPPKLFSVKKGETEYSFNALPFGGFVKIFGETPDEESLTGPDRSRSFIHKPKYIQAAVLSAGIIFNFVLAWLLLSIGLIAGLPSTVGQERAGVEVTNVSLMVTGVLDESPAGFSGLIQGDKITSVSDPTSSIDVLTPEAVKEFVSSRPGQELIVTFERDDISQSVTLLPQIGLVEESVPAIGIAMDLVGILKLPVHKALIEGAKLTATITKDTVVSLSLLIRDAFIGEADISKISGPVGIVGVVGDAAQLGFVFLLSLTAIISINLAIINLIPFPALDGGRLLFLLIEKIKGSPINPSIANTLNAIGFFLLILLMVVVTFFDIGKLL
ncbi:hypothetical protein COB64_01745 [Candidatus Wolfebacteria bacterium]|nr:MAG: hypothetical protein COB64_01745 [Candidatus Wolfebacteria bacterium]